MAHFHQHSCECKHENLKLCKTCKVPFCQDCGKEWAEPCKQYHGGWWPSYPWYATSGNIQVGGVTDLSPSITYTDNVGNATYNVGNTSQHTHG